MATVVVTVKERIATIPSGVSLVCNNPNVNKKVYLECIVTYFASKSKNQINYIDIC